jgi:hypothetical protein
VIENAKGKQQPDDDANDDDNVENFFYLSIHRNIGVDEPEQYADDYQGDDERNQWYILPPVWMSVLLFTI